MKSSSAESRSQDPVAPTRDAAVVVSEFDSSDADVWAEFVSRSDEATLFHTLAWRDVLRSTFRHEDRYHLVDWKTNHLGDRPGDYGPRALARVMAEDLYVLQYHLYALALHLHLRSRVPGYDYDRHFGGVHYVFLRGLDPARPGHGVFRDRPPRERVAALAEYLGLPG